MTPKLAQIDTKSCNVEQHLCLVAACHEQFVYIAPLRSVYSAENCDVDDSCSREVVRPINGADGGSSSNSFALFFRSIANRGEVVSNGRAA